MTDDKHRNSKKGNRGMIEISRYLSGEIQNFSVIKPT